MASIGFNPASISTPPSPSPSTSDIGRNVTGWLEYLYRLQIDDINHEASTAFIRRTWLVSVYASALYIILLYLGLKIMKSRTPFSLRLPLAVWSATLCLFSLIGSLAVWPEFLELAQNHGIVATYCDNSYRKNSRLFYWYTVFTLSKLLELGDTVFIVLRKQKLPTLHFVHHILTLIFCFYVYRDEVSTARWMVGLNFAVHSLMYGYYSLKALRVPIPRPIGMIITTGQIVQMILGLLIHVHTLLYALFIDPNPCQCSLRGSIAGFLLYALFFYFFIRFFVDSYLGKSKTK